MGDNNGPDDARSSPQAKGPDEVVELDVREIGGGIVARARRNRSSSLARSAGETAMSISLAALQRGTNASLWALRKAASSPPGRLLSEMASGAADALVDDVDVDWHGVGRVAEERIGHVISVVTPVIVQALDPTELMEYIDLDAILETIDVNELMGRVDVHALISRVDVNALMDRVDVNTLMEHVDVNALMERVDVNMVLDHVDVNAMLARVDANEFLEGVDINAIASRIDIDAILARVDVAGVAKRANIGELVAESTSDVAGSALDLGRRQGVALDTLLGRTVSRVLGRDPDAMPQGPPRLVEDHPDGET